MDSDRIFGDIPGVSEGDSFISRRELSKAGVHRPTQAGISGSQTEGADSVVLSGGYDDKDLGDTIIYTGHGGRDENTGEYIADQELTRQNLALVVSKERGLPVRVIRGANHQSEYAPQEGYRYDGLYLVEDFWKDNVSNHVVLRFKLSKITALISPAKVMPTVLTGENTGSTPSRRIFQTLRVVRDTKKALEVKKFYDYQCQVCDIRLEGRSGPYAEAAHIMPLGSPHNGPDDQDNILCLCPNHHVLFDSYAFTINDDFTLIGIAGKLNVKPGHNINNRYLAYRREHYSLKND